MRNTPLPVIATNMAKKNVSPCRNWLLLFLLISTIQRLVDANQKTDDVGGSIQMEYIHFSFNPPKIEDLIMENTARVYIGQNSSVELEGTNRTDAKHVELESNSEIVCALSNDESIAQVLDAGNISDNGSELLVTGWNSSSFRVHGIFLGRTVLTFFTKLPSNNTKPNHDFIFKRPLKIVPCQDIKEPSHYSPSEGHEDRTVSNLSKIRTRNGEWMHELPGQYKVAIIREFGLLDKLFLAIVGMLVICANFGMGCKIDLNVVKEVLRRPFAPAIGFFCQFVIMPSLAYGVARLLGLRGGAALGFFATGCAPGGGSSNMYTYLLGGDVSLSVTMTLVSLIASLGMIPLWILTLGQQLLSESVGDSSQFTIPFENILISLVSMLIPVAVGLLIQFKRPLWAKRVVGILKPVFIVFILFMFTAGVYTNLYVFKLFTPMLIVAGFMLPYIGFLLGGLLALLCRQPRNRIVAIIIETGIQNTGIPIILMKLCLPQPEADLSVVAPIIVAMLTPLPLWVAVSVLEIRRRCCTPKRDTLPVVPESPDTDSAEKSVHLLSTIEIPLNDSKQNGEPIANGKPHNANSYHDV